MLKAIHHNTLAKAKRSGVTVEITKDGKFYMAADGKVSYVGNNAANVLDDVLFAAVIRTTKAYNSYVTEYRQLVDHSYVVKFPGIEVVKPTLKAAFMEAYEAYYKDNNDGDDDSDDDGDGDDTSDDDGDDTSDDDGDNSDCDVTADGDGDGEQEGKGSVVKPKYRKLYKPHRDKCGDQLAQDITEYVVHRPDENDVARVDMRRLKRLAEANNVWDERYSELNPGMARMNVGNRLRGLLRKGQEIVWP